MPASAPATLPIRAPFASSLREEDPTRFYPMLSSPGSAGRVPLRGSSALSASAHAACRSWHRSAAAPPPSMPMTAPIAPLVASASPPTVPAPASHSTSTWATHAPSAAPNQNSRPGHSLSDELPGAEQHHDDRAHDAAISGREPTVHHTGRSRHQAAETEREKYFPHRSPTEPTDRH